MPLRSEKFASSLCRSGTRLSSEGVRALREIRPKTWQFPQRICAMDEPHFCDAITQRPADEKNRSASTAGLNSFAMPTRCWTNPTAFGR